MHTAPIEHPYFKELPVDWENRIPINVTLKNSKRHVAEDYVAVARSGLALRSVVDATGNLSVLTRDGVHSIPVEHGEFDVLEWLNVAD